MPAVSNEDLVRQFLATAEELYGAPPPVRATFEVQEISGELHAEWDRERNHVTIRIQPGWDDYQRKGRLAHESFHVFSPATLSEATYLDEGLAALLAKHGLNYLPFPDQTKYCEALSLVERLIATCPKSVRKLIDRGRRIAIVSASDIVAACHKFPASDADLLVRKFYA
jgi:hypothetical protein